MDLAQLDVLSDAHVIEAAVVVLSPLMGVDDPSQVSDRVMALSGGQPDKATMSALVQRAGEEATDDVADLLRLLMAAESVGAAPNGARVDQAVNAAGSKQMVITPDLLYLAAGLVACVVVAWRNPKLSENQRVVIEEMPDGRIKIVVDRQAKYFNPFSPLVALIRKIADFSSEAGDDA